MKIISVGGGVLAGTESLLLTCWSHVLQHLSMTGPKRHDADRCVHAQLLTWYHAWDALFQRASHEYRPFKKSWETPAILNQTAKCNHSQDQKPKGLTKKNKNFLSLATVANTGRTRNPYNNGQGGSLTRDTLHLLTLSQSHYRAACRKPTGPMDPCKKPHPNGNTVTRRTASSGIWRFLWACLFWEREDRRKARLPDKQPPHLEGHLPQKRKAISYFTEEISSVLRLQ